jgi:hypothetical protein
VSIANKKKRKGSIMACMAISYLSALSFRIMGSIPRALPLSSYNMNVNFLFHTTNIGTENHKQEHEMPSHMV